jgi:hypothetical protein
MKKLESHLAVLFGIALMLGSCGILDDLGEEGEEKAQASATIGPEGGTLQAPGVILVVPPGALGGEIELSVESVSAPQVESLSAVSPAFRFGPLGLQFESPVTVTFDFEAAGSSVPKLYWSKPGDQGGFDEVGGTVEGSRIHGKVSHFSVGFVAVASSGGGGGEATREESCEARCRKRESLSCLPSKGRDYDGCMDVCAKQFDEYPSTGGDACVAALIKENMCIADRWECEDGLPTTDRCQMEEHWTQAWCFMGKGPDSACESMGIPEGMDPFPCPESHPIKSYCYGEAPDRSCIQPQELGLAGLAYCCVP